jgi:ornithine cyclodeaminase/alanine dehydrogenase-like protein (mu-crystallin family)
LEASEITGWRTAAASVVATAHMHRGKKEVLAILGAGVQGRTHAMALKHYFNFKEVKINFKTVFYAYCELKQLSSHPCRQTNYKPLILNLKVRIWNRNPEKARKLCAELGSPQIYKPYSSNESCVRGADVICTTTYASEPIVKNSWLKDGAHINGRLPKIK